METSFQDGESIFPGFTWSIAIRSTTAMFPSGVAITGHIRRYVNAPDPPIAVMSTADSSIARVDDYNLNLSLPGSASAGWIAGFVYMDLVRTDTNPDEYFRFRLKVPVEITVTRL